MKKIAKTLLSVAIMAMCICQPLAIRAESQLDKDFKTPPHAARLQAY